MTCAGEPCSLDCDGKSCDLTCKTKECSVNCDDGSGCRLECHQGADNCAILGCPEPVQELSCTGFTLKLCKRPGESC